MPIYTIECPECGLVEDASCHHSEVNNFTCAKCNSPMVHKPTAPNFIINGYKSHKGTERKNYE